MAAIALDGVTKRFRDVVAVDELDLKVEEGEVFGFLGPNGAGKTTTIDLMLDFVRPTTGRVEVLGMPVGDDPVAVRRRCGVLPEGVDVWERLTGRQHLAFAIDSKDVDDDPAALLQRVGLGDAMDRRAGGYSTGMVQRLMLAMALVGEPDLLILDEPSTGLDPNGAREMRQIVREENERGATVFFSSHLLDQVDAVCDRVGILRAGQMVTTDTADGLRDSVGTGTVLHVSVDRLAEEALAGVSALPEVSRVETDDVEEPTMIVHTDGSNATVVSAIEEAGVEVVDFRTEETSLEEVFQAYTTDEVGA